MQDPGGAGWKRSRELYIEFQHCTSNRSGKFGDYARYWIGKSLVTPNAQSTLSNPWVTEQLGGKNDQVGVAVICATELIQ